MKSSMARITGFVAAGLLAAGAHVAIAGPGHGPGAGFGGPGGGGSIEQAIASVHDQLNLNTSQQAMWDSVVTNAKSTRAAGRAGMEQVHAALVAELAKPEPDLAAVAAISDQSQGNAAAARKVVRDQWLALYATFTPAQKAVVRDALAKRVARMDAFRARMQERRGGAVAN